MSKLFDTLEKIQEKEASSPPAEESRSPRPAKKTGRYFPFLLGLTIIVAMMAAGQYLPVFKKSLSRPPQKPQTTSQATTPAQKPQPSYAASQTDQGDKLAGPAQVEYFNNHAVALTEKGDAWAALYYFDKASKLAPTQPEPLINMAVILSQMDLGFPAGRIFKQAYQLAPENEHLLQAIELAIAEHVLPPDFYETIPISGIDGK